MNALVKDKFYEVFAQHLTAYMRREKINVSDLVRISGEQNKTIKGMLNGRRFSAHHLAWIAEHTSIDLNAITEEIKNGDDKKEKTIQKQTVSAWI